MKCIDIYISTYCAYCCIVGGSLFDGSVLDWLLYKSFITTSTKIPMILRQIKVILCCTSSSTLSPSDPLIPKRITSEALTAIPKVISLRRC